MPHKVNLAEKFAAFDGHWAPRIVGRYNGNEVRLAKASGDFQWHSHSGTDELFLVIEGELQIEFRGHVETVCAGEMIVVPRGVEHFPRALKGEVKMLIIDPADTPNTGNAQTAFVPTEI